MPPDTGAPSARPSRATQPNLRIAAGPVDQIAVDGWTVSIGFPLTIGDAGPGPLKAVLEIRNAKIALARQDATLTRDTAAGEDRWRFAGEVDLKPLVLNDELGEQDVCYFNLRIVGQAQQLGVAHIAYPAPALPLLADRSAAHFLHRPTFGHWWLVFSRTTGRLQVRRVPSSISHVRLEQVRGSGKYLHVAGAAIVSSVDSDALKPEIVVRRRRTTVEVVFPARKTSRPDVNTALASDYADHTQSGFEADIDLAVVYDAGILRERFGDIYVRLTRSDGAVFERRLSGPSETLRETYGNDDICAFKTVKPGSDIYAYLTKDAYDLTLTYRDRVAEDSWPYRLREFVAAALFYLCGGREGRQWLAYETFSSTAQDNAFVFFEWMRKHHPEQPLYYIIRDDSADRGRLAPYGRNVLSYYSVRHLFHLLRARLLVSSQSRTHAYKIRPLRGLFKRHLMAKTLVFLQHGVTAFKRSPFHKTDPNGNANLLITVSRRERDIVLRHWQYPDRDVAVTGFPRFDVLQDRADENGRKTILIMPTWRWWLEGSTPDEFAASDFCKAYSSLLSDHGLLAFLERADMTVTFYLHITLLKYLPLLNAASPRIRVVTVGEEPVNTLLMKAAVLVTDYSSVAWDFHYMQKPVVFFHFDVDRYLQVHGSFVNLKDELFGPKAHDVASLVRQIIDTASNPHPVATTEDEFLYSDRLNCQRVYTAIADRFGY